MVKWVLAILVSGSLWGEAPYRYEQIYFTKQLLIHKSPDLELYAQLCYDYEKGSHWINVNVFQPKKKHQPVDGTLFRHRHEEGFCLHEVQFDGNLRSVKILGNEYKFSDKLKNLCTDLEECIDWKRSREIRNKFPIIAGK